MANIAWDIYGFARDAGLVPGVLAAPTADTFDNALGWGHCGSPGQVVTRQNRSGLSNGSPPSACNNLPLPGQAFPTVNGQNGAVHHNPGDTRTTFVGIQYIIPGVSNRPPMPGVSKTTDFVVQHPDAMRTPEPVPYRYANRRQTAPTANMPGRHTGAGSKGRYHTGRFEPEKPDFPGMEGFNIGRPGGQAPNPHQPPKQKQTEKKAKAPVWFAKLVDTAWATTEYCDMIDAMYDCLPDGYKKLTKKRGRTSHTAVLGPGKAYSTCADKAEAVYSGKDWLTAECATKKLVCNHLMDEVLGRFFGTADRAAARGKVNGFGHAMGYGDGYYLSTAEKAKIKKWIKSQPGLEDFLESVACDNVIGLFQ